jgi:hypothetical protein
VIFIQAACCRPKEKNNFKASRIILLRTLQTAPMRSRLHCTYHHLVKGEILKASLHTPKCCRLRRELEKRA